jgi:rSAM/selenodomain-associated transferase 2
MRLSIIIPVLDAGEAIATTLDALADLRALGVEVIVADGGSRDATVQRARLRADRVVAAPRGRAAQMNAGADKATGDVLLFLDPETRLPPQAEHLVLDGLARSGQRSGHTWGCFKLRYEGGNVLLGLLAVLMNLRTLVTGGVSGDQAMFVKQEVFSAVGGFPAIPLMENVALCKRLRAHGRPLCLAERTTAARRRWDRIGILPMFVLMVRLRLAYAFGTDPVALDERYRAALKPAPTGDSSVRQA